MSKIIAVEVSDTVYGMLARQARDIGRGTKPENIAEEWLTQRAKESNDRARKFIEAGRIVDRRMASGNPSD